MAAGRNHDAPEEHVGPVDRARRSVDCCFPARKEGIVEDQKRLTLIPRLDLDSAVLVKTSRAKPTASPFCQPGGRLGTIASFSAWKLRSVIASSAS
jgi:hypothetical protein